MVNELTVATKVACDVLHSPASLTHVSGKGSCNHAFIAADGAEKVVVRVNANRDRREFAKEAWCMAQAQIAGVNAPRSLGHGVVHGWNYGIQSYAGNGNGADQPDQALIWHWLGRTAARVHQIPVAGFGVTRLDEEGRFDGDWQRYLGDNLRAVAHQDACAWLSSDEAAILRHRFERLAGGQVRFGLCHGDLTPRNVVLDAERMTLVDWGCAEAHVVPHFDLRELLREYASDTAEVSAFAAGYGLGDDGLRAILPEVEDLLLLCAFDLVRWAQDRSPGQMAEKQEQLCNYLHRFQTGQ